MLIYVKKKTFYGQTDGQTDGRTTQNYSSVPHKRFDQIKSCFHIAFNQDLADGRKKVYDRLFKFKQLYDHVLENCRKIPVGENLSIDEQTIPYKGKKSKMKMYNKAKPKKWGFKVYAMCAARTGLIHNFYLYTGKKKNL